MWDKKFFFVQKDTECARKQFARKRVCDLNVKYHFSVDI